MTKRPLCMVCLVLMLLMCVADRAGFPLIRGNPVPGKCGLLDPGTSQGHNLRRSDTDHRK